MAHANIWSEAVLFVVSKDLGPVVQCFVSLTGLLVVMGLLGGAKVSCILRHRGVQLILAYRWAKYAILVAGKGRGGCYYFFCFFTFIPVPFSSLFLSFISSTISSISFLPFSGRRHKMTRKGWRVVKSKHNQLLVVKMLTFLVSTVSNLQVLLLKKCE